MGCFVLRERMREGGVVGDVGSMICFGKQAFPFYSFYSLIVFFSLFFVVDGIQEEVGW